MMQIGETAKASGLKVETGRFYEAQGLVGEAQRTKGNFRLYDDTQLKRLSFIRRARDLGFTLDQVRELLRLTDDPQAPCAEVDLIATTHIAELDRKLETLQAMRTDLLEWLSTYGRDTIADCRIVDGLSLDH